MNKEELQAKLEKANKENKGIVVYPEYFKKKRKRMSDGIRLLLENTAKSDYTDADDFGVYKAGTFLFKDCIVTVNKVDGIWSLHLMSEHSIGLPTIKEARYKFLPDKVVMVQVFGSRVEEKELKGVVLYQIPDNVNDCEE